MIGGTLGESITTILAVITGLLGIWAVVSACVAGVVYVIAMGLGAIFAFTVAPFWIFLLACAVGIGVLFLIGASS